MSLQITINLDKFLLIPKYWYEYISTWNSMMKMNPSFELYQCCMQADFSSIGILSKEKITFEMVNAFTVFKAFQIQNIKNVNMK